MKSPLRHIVTKSSIAFSLVCLCCILSGCGSKSDFTGTQAVYVAETDSYSEGDFLIVDAVLKNTNPSVVTQTAYRVIWQNGSGQEIHATGWRPVKIKGSRGVHIMEHSSVPGAESFEIQLSNATR